MLTQVNTILREPSTPFEKLQCEYLRSMVLDNRTERTIEFWAMTLFRFNLWCIERGIEKLDELSPEVLNGYRQWLFHQTSKRTKQRLRFCTQNSYLMVVRRWLTWLHKKGYLEEDLAKDFEIPKAEKRLPREVFTASEVESMLNATNINKPLGIRDRAIMEVLYSTGIRNTELRNLALYDIDEERGTLAIRQGKGQKDRFVPIGQRALDWTKKYASDVRPDLLNASENHQYLFVTNKGRKLKRCQLGYIVRGYKEKVGIKKAGSCHLLRHTAATLMMDNGADIRSLQEFLGHSRLTTTQVYTHVSISRLRDVHAKTHPASCEKKRKRKK